MSTIKGQKRIKNQPILHEELKKQRAVWLTSKTWGEVQESAARLKISASEYVEQMIRERHGE